MRPFLPFVLGVIFVIVALGIESEEDPALFVLQMVLGPQKLFVKIIWSNSMFVGELDSVHYLYMQSTHLNCPINIRQSIF
jgi:hypothetical protein